MTSVMELARIQQGVRIWSGVVAALVFLLLILVFLCWKPREIILSAFSELQQSMKKNGKGFLDYQKMEEKLRRNGASYHYGNWVDPIRFLALRLVLGAVGLMLGLRFGYLQGILLAIVVFWAPDGMLTWMNGKDNERMIPELKLVYQAISMQIRSGVYVTDALVECYGSVKERRLRDALLTLSGDITMKADVEEALERFRSRFDNQYVDALCITILQALESGQAVELLSDIAEQIRDLETTMMEKRKTGMDRSITFYQLGILAAILAVVLYACVTHMFSAALSF